MYYIFYKTEDGFSPSNDPQGAFLTQDISSYSLQQGDDIYIEWTLGIPSLLDTQLPLYGLERCELSRYKSQRICIWR